MRVDGLNGDNSYLIHFPADHLPQSAVDSYWSVILVGVRDYRVVENPLKPYEADGSLKIAIGPKAVEDVPDSNWLPAPSGREFSLTFRTYVPKELVRRGEWAPPAVTLVQWCNDQCCRDLLLPRDGSAGRQVLDRGVQGIGRV
jgi:hypothetical protein